MPERKKWSDGQLENIWTYRNGACVEGYCPKLGCPFKRSPMIKTNYGDGSDISWVVDHIVPVAKGGTNNLNNLQPMHNYCNAQKSDNRY